MSPPKNRDAAVTSGGDGHESDDDAPRVKADEGERKPDVPVVSLADARRRRGEALLAAEDVPDQVAEARCWGDRGRAS